jgi:UDP-2,3-diacylglucosamine hydrolase
VSSFYFISDLHLDAARTQTGRLLERFTQALIHDKESCAALYILGDLFDAWVGDDDDSLLASRTRQTLKAFTAAGPDLYVMHGNRDFLLGEDFCSATGAQLLQDPFRLDLFGRRALLMHGDLLCIDDVDYQRFRSSVRQPQWRDAVLAKPLEQRRLLARTLRQASNEAKSNKPEDIVDVHPEEVDRVMREADAELLIHGHTHRPGQHRVACGSRWVLGDWEHRPTALKVNSEEIQLIDIQ